MAMEVESATAASPSPGWYPRRPDSLRRSATGARIRGFRRDDLADTNHNRGTAQPAQVTMARQPPVAQYLRRSAIRLRAREARYPPPASIPARGLRSASVRPEQVPNSLAGIRPAARGLRLPGETVQRPFPRQHVPLWRLTGVRQPRWRAARAVPPVSRTLA